MDAGLAWIVVALLGLAVAAFAGFQFHRGVRGRARRRWSAYVRGRDLWRVSRVRTAQAARLAPPSTKLEIKKSAHVQRTRRR